MKKDANEPKFRVYQSGYGVSSHRWRSFYSWARGVRIFSRLEKRMCEILRTLDGQLGYMAIGHIADVMNLGTILNCRILGIYCASEIKK